MPALAQLSAGGEVTSGRRPPQHDCYNLSVCGVNAGDVYSGKGTVADPTNGLSALRLLSASRAGTSVTVSWQSVAGVNYFL